jgi:pyroglutamyl-peptidase
MRLLLTGFEPFGALPFNPSQLLVQQIRDAAPLADVHELTAEILPTAYHRAGTLIEERLRALRPDLLLATGLAETRSELNLERIALNLDDADKPDNAGRLREGNPIEPDGPLALRTTLDLAPLLARLRGAGFAAKVSNHAGAFVCNHVYYCALSAIARHRLPTQALFLHVPMTGSAWTVDRLADGTRLLIAALAEQLITQAATA